ncbi:MAG: choice-of-anchor V domain-containing protein [Bryobacteraceae bacterium]
MQWKPWILAAVVSCVAVRADSDGMRAGFSGVPGESNCAACHNGDGSSAGGSMSLTIVGSNFWVPGQRVRMILRLTDRNAKRWGFQLTPRAFGDPNRMAGTLHVTQTSTKFASGSAPGFQYLTHTLAGTFPNTTGSATWEFEWTAPSDPGFGNVSFYISAVAANGDGKKDSGDYSYTGIWQFQPGTPATGLVRVLPQLAFGDVWSTTVYLHNTSGAPVQAAVRFYDTGGAPLTVPGLNASSVTLNLGPRGTGVVEAPRLGPLTQGSIAVEAPAEVIGYGIFRQEQPNVNPQEGVVPLSSSTSTGATIVYDDTATFVTSVAVLNPGSTPVTVTVVARDDTGAQTGTLTLNLNARERVAFEVRNRPELAMVQGRRGVLEFSSAGGPVAVLGLRFNGFALTSILPVEQQAGP